MTLILIQDIQRSLVKLDNLVMSNRKSLLEAARTIAQLKSRAYVIAQCTTTQYERENMTTELIKDLLRLTLPDGVSYKDLENEL